MDVIGSKVSFKSLIGLKLQKLVLTHLFKFGYQEMIHFKKVLLSTANNTQTHPNLDYCQ